MTRDRLRITRITVQGLLLVGLLNGAVDARAQSTGLALRQSVRPLVAQTPSIVSSGTASLIVPHDASSILNLAIGLAPHNAAELDQIIAAASDPNSPSYGHYLTRDEYMARFAPTSQEVDQIKGWATSQGLSVDGSSPDNLLVQVSGTTTAVNQAFGVTINDYNVRGQLYMANNHDPLVPQTLNINAVSGLTGRHHIQTARLTDHMVGLTRLQSASYPLTPNAFRTAYNASGVGDGSGQTIGLTLWGAPVPQQTFDQFGQQTGTPTLTVGSGDDTITWTAVNGGSTDLNEQVETAMDAEYAHGLAPHSHLRYYLSDCSFSSTTGSCNPSDLGLEMAVNAAANDASLHIVSNSWGGSEPFSTSDPFVINIDTSLQMAASLGTTFYFASGDAGLNSGGTALPSFPADSPYVVGVGGTALTLNNDTTFASETSWNFSGGHGGGGGCSTVFARPSWQTGVGAATCSGRAVPDISADADPATGAYVVYTPNTGGSPVAATVGGTSLAAPLWAGMAADMNRALSAAGKPLMGFSAPHIYALATNAAEYARDFHDVTSGNNGYPAGTGWDQSTGWGSPNLAALYGDWTGSSAVLLPTSPTAIPVPITIPTAIPTATATPLPLPTSTTAPTATPPPTGTPVPPQPTRSIPSPTPSPHVTTLKAASLQAPSKKAPSKKALPVTLSCTVAPRIALKKGTHVVLRETISTRILLHGALTTIVVLQGRRTVYASSVRLTIRPAGKALVTRTWIVPSPLHGSFTAHARLASPVGLVTVDCGAPPQKKTLAQKKTSTHKKATATSRHAVHHSVTKTL